MDGFRGYQSINKQTTNERTCIAVSRFMKMDRNGGRKCRVTIQQSIKSSQLFRKISEKEPVSCSGMAQ
jgi:hypothetical protein